MQSIIKARGLFVNHTFKTSSPSLFVLPSNHVVASPSQQQQQQYIPTTFSSSLLTNTQVRHGGKHLPMSLKGRRGWKKVLEKKKVLCYSLIFTPHFPIFYPGRLYLFQRTAINKLIIIDDMII